MKLWRWSTDGGPDSTVQGFFLIEAKKLFSVAVLRFSNGSREAFHDHAFNAVSWVLKGKLVEHYRSGELFSHTRSVRPIFTARDTFHKVYSVGTTWVFTIRGPWVDTWREFFSRTGETVVLTHGRTLVRKDTK